MENGRLDLGGRFTTRFYNNYFPGAQRTWAQMRSSSTYEMSVRSLGFESGVLHSWKTLRPSESTTDVLTNTILDIFI